MTALPPHAFAGPGRIGSHVMATLAHFGSSRLSEREAVVARLILQGHSSKVIARMLGNSPETVKASRLQVIGEATRRISPRRVRSSERRLTC